MLGIIWKLVSFLFIGTLFVMIDWQKHAQSYYKRLKKVWKSEFDQELLSYLNNNNRRMLDIIRKIHLNSL